jgi:hypothetical protein
MTLTCTSTRKPQGINWVRDVLRQERNGEHQANSAERVIDSLIHQAWVASGPLRIPANVTADFGDPDLRRFYLLCF